MGALRIVSTKACKIMVAAVICATCGVIGSLAATGRGEGTPFHGFLPVYVMYLIVAAGIGFLQPDFAWMAGAVIMPAHWVVALASGAALPTSTVGVGHLFTILLSVPLAMASHLGGWASCVGSRRA